MGRCGPCLCDNGGGELHVRIDDVGVATIGVVSATIDITADSGCTGKGTGTITTTIQIPAGSLVLGVTARVTTNPRRQRCHRDVEPRLRRGAHGVGRGLGLGGRHDHEHRQLHLHLPGPLYDGHRPDPHRDAGKIIDSGVVKLAIHYLSLDAGCGIGDRPLRFKQTLLGVAIAFGVMVAGVTAQVPINYLGGRRSCRPPRRRRHTCICWRISARTIPTDGVSRHRMGGASPSSPFHRGTGGHAISLILLAR